MYSANRSFDVGGEGKFNLMHGIVFDLLIHPLNKVGFTIERPEYRYSTKNGPVDSLTRNIYLAYYVPPNPYTDQTIPTSTETSPYVVRNPPLVFQESIDYLWKHYQEGILFLDLTAFIQDDAEHRIEK